MDRGSAESRQLTGSARSGTRLKLVVTSALSLLLLVLALRQVDFGVLEKFLANANYGDVAVAVVVYFVDLGFRSARWCVLLRPFTSIPARRLYPVLAIGYMVNNLLPARIGELSRAYLVGRREDVSSSTVLASVALERIIDGFTVLVLLLLSLPAIPMADWLGALTRVAAVMTVVAVVAGLLLAVARPTWIGIASRCLRALPDRTQAKAVRLLDRFIVGFTVLRDVRSLAATLVLSVVIWGVGAVTYLFVALALGVHLSFLAALAAICVVNIATAVPLAPAGLGAFEVAAVAMLTLLGVNDTIAAGVTIVLHAVLFVPVVIAGLIFLWRLDLTLGTLWNDTGSSEPIAVLEQTG